MVLLAVLVAGVAGGVVTPLWYLALQDVHARLVPPGGRNITDFRTAPLAAKLLDFARGFVVAAVLAYVLHAAGATTVAPAVGLAVLLWLGFPAVLLVAPVIWGGESWRLQLLHAGDWLIKLVVMAVMISLLS
jgi:hypothetical protein